MHRDALPLILDQLGVSLAERQDVTQAEAAWVLREPGSGTRAIFEATLAVLGLDLARLDVAPEQQRDEAVISVVLAALAQAGA